MTIPAGETNAPSINLIDEMIAASIASRLSRFQELLDQWQVMEDSLGERTEHRYPMAPFDTRLDTAAEQRRPAVVSYLI